MDILNKLPINVEQIVKTQCLLVKDDRFGIMRKE